MSDSINHPPHYNTHPSGVECIDIVEHMNFCLGNAIKYIWRAGLKDSANQLEDLKKARWYVEREISRIERLDGKERDETRKSVNEFRTEKADKETMFGGWEKLDYRREQGGTK